MRQWCRLDPVIRLGGDEVRLIVAVPMAERKNVTGPVKVRVTGRDGGSFELLSQDKMFGFKPEYSYEEKEDVTPWADYWIEVFVPADESFPVEVEARPLGTSQLSTDINEEGTANTWVLVEV